MKEKPVQFLSTDLTLEGRLAHGDARRGVVISHPHPLYGGDLHNPVVESLVRAYSRRGYTTLRFNFRGVGNSEGRHDEGRGEQADVRAAMSFLAQEGLERIELAGYSFGAWVNALVGCGPVEPDIPVAVSLVMVSPPVAFIDFDAVGPLPGLKLVVTGSRDDIAPPGLISPRVEPNAAIGQAGDRGDQRWTGVERADAPATIVR